MQKDSKTRQSKDLRHQTIDCSHNRESAFFPKTKLSLRYCLVSNGQDCPLLRTCGVSLWAKCVWVLDRKWREDRTHSRVQARTRSVSRLTRKLSRSRSSANHTTIKYSMLNVTCLARHPPKKTSSQNDKRSTDLKTCFKTMTCFSHTLWTTRWVKLSKCCWQASADWRVKWKDSRKWSGNNKLTRITPRWSTNHS